MRTTPYAHQQEEWDISREMPTRAVFWEQGTGKTKLVLDTFFDMDRQGLVDGLLVVAPNGVHENWMANEIPKHAWHHNYLAFAYQSHRASTKWHQRAVQDVIDTPKLAALFMSYDGFMTEKGTKVAKKFLEKRKTLYVLDESQRIKTPSAKRTKRIVASGKYAAFRRILSGTPVTNKPFDIYTQMRFIDPDFWKDRGYASYEAFKTYFGVWEDRITETGQRFKTCLYYKNLEQLHAMVDEVSSRVLKADVLDLPPKIYTKRYFELSADQKKRYRDIKEDFCTELESGELIAAPLIITQLLRLQQITCGYLPRDDEGPMVRFPQNPRLKALLDTLADVEGKAIIFARFRQDLDQICKELGKLAVRYDGGVEPAKRKEAIDRFQDPDDPVRFFVGNPAACATGLTLTAAKTVIYYSNSFDWEHRTQSEDRAHRIGQESSVNYIDLIATGTVDTRIVQSLRDKDAIATKITGDNARDWL